jgi:hypothetical protein
MSSLRILFAAVGHLVLAYASAVAATGWDMDQLRSRSRTSEAAGVVHDVLMYPHDLFLRALPNARLVRYTYVMPGAILLDSLLRGAAPGLVWHAARRRRHRA